jgi:xylan 1,4-beta-xylosidase
VKRQWSVFLAGAGLAAIGLLNLPSANCQEIPDDEPNVSVLNAPAGTFIEAEAHPITGRKTVDDAEASGGKAVSASRAWGSIAYAPLPAGPKYFQVWVRHKHGPLLVKSSIAGKHKDLRWIRSNPTKLTWSDGGTFTREAIGDGILIARNDKKGGPEAEVDAIVLAPAKPLPPMPVSTPDDNAAPKVVQATIQWNQTVATMRPEMWGFNDFELRDPEKANQPAYQKLLSELHPAIIRIHHGDIVGSWTNAQTRTWNIEKIKAGVNASTGYKGAKIMLNIAKWPKWLSNGPTLSPAEEDEFAKLVGDLVRITRDINFPVAYWEVPNEYERGYEKAGKINDLWRLWHKMAAEIRRADPQARVGGPALSSPETRWIEGFLKNCGQSADFLTWHNYATGDIYTSNAAIFARPAAIAKIAAETRALVQKWVPNRKMELFMTEHNIKWVWDPIEPRHSNNVGTVFHASMIRNLALTANGQGIDGMMMWHVKGAAYGIIAGNNTPFPPYHLFRWGTSYLSGNIAVHSSSDESSLEVLPVVRADKTRSLLLIVKADRRVTIPAGAALFPTSASQVVRAQRVDAQGYSEQLDMPKAGTWTLPGYSVTLLTTAQVPVPAATGQ